MITDISLGGVSLTTTQWYCLGLSNPTFFAIQHSQSRRGNYPGVAIYAGKPLSYKFAGTWLIVGTTFSDLATQRENFRKLLSTILSNGSAVLTVTKSNGVILTSTVKSVKLSGDIKAEDKTATEILVEMESEYPFLLSQTVHNTTVNIFNGGGMAVPMAVPMDMSAGGSNEATINNAGEYLAYPTLEFYGPLINPTITNVTTGEQLSISYTLPTVNDKLTVDCYNRTAIVSPANTNARQYVSGSFLTLKPGDNKIRLGNGDTSQTGYANVIYNDHYMGI